MKKILLLIMISLVISAVGCTNNANVGENEEVSKFPEKTIELIVPYDAGGATDLIARTLEKNIKDYLPNGKGIVVVNKAGGAGTVGTADVFQAKPDGYTIGLAVTGPMSLQPNYGNIPYTHDSLQPVIRIATSPHLLAVRADAEWDTFDQWLEFVKSNPGDFTYGSSGTGNPAHIAMERFNHATGCDTKNVAFDGSSPVYTALLGGHIMGEVAAAQEIQGQLASGEIRIIANLGSIKGEAYKDVPTLKEKGIDVSSEVYFGIVAPKGIPEDVLTILHDSFKNTIEDPKVVEEFKTLGVEINYAGPEEFQKNITDTYNTYGEILKDIGLIK